MAAIIGSHRNGVDLKSSMDDYREAGGATSRLALYVPTLAGGGAEQSMLRLAEEFVARGHTVDLLLNRRTGAYANRVPAGVRVIELARRSKLRARLAVLRAYPGDLRAICRPVLLAARPVMSLRYLPGLADYLARARPSVLISAMFYANLLTIWARRLSGVGTRIIVSEHNMLSLQIAEGRVRRHERARWWFLPGLIGRLYPRANAILAVSNGVADDLAKTAGLERRTVRTIYNPVVFPGLERRAAEPIEYPWFAPDAPPVLLAAGRLEAQKNFELLLDAFADLRRRRRLRLIILGEGSLRDALQQRAERLGVAADVELRGWVDNPYAYMRRAAAFVLSSNWEGLGNVLIEAMACGCPVVATDCPSGPREILADGQYGRLVAVNDAAALADAIRATLDAPRQPDRLRGRAAMFSIENSAQRYLALIDAIVGRTNSQPQVSSRL